MDHAKHEPEESAVLSISEVCYWLGIGKNTAYLAAKRGEIPTIRIGRRILVPRKRFEQLLAGDPSGCHAIEELGAVLIR